MSSSFIARRSFAITSRRVSRHGTAAQRRLVFLDLEMTGPQPNNDLILEAAIVVTDRLLQPIAACEHTVHRSLPQLQLCNEWATHHHQKSGLWDAALAAQLDIDQVDVALESFLKEHVPAKTCALAGLSVHIDRQFCEMQLPRTAAWVHPHRIVDVSSIDELAMRWQPKIREKRPRPGSGAHRALADCYSAIAILAHYKKNFFVE